MIFAFFLTFFIVKMNEKFKNKFLFLLQQDLHRISALRRHAASQTLHFLLFPSTFKYPEHSAKFSTPFRLVLLIRFSHSSEKFQIPAKTIFSLRDPKNCQKLIQIHQDTLWRILSNSYQSPHDSSYQCVARINKTHSRADRFEGIDN